MGILTSSRLAEALDLSKEDPRVVERYGTGDDKVHIDENGAPACRKVSWSPGGWSRPGVRVVTLNYSNWDWHGHPYGSCFDRCREDLTVLDKAFSALIDDLHERGLDSDVTVVVWGEFGRTPRINRTSAATIGRKWPAPVGRRRHANRAGHRRDRPPGRRSRGPPRHFPEVFATLYHNLGIDAASVTSTISTAARSIWSTTTPNRWPS